jgi:hypothetical protein
LWQSSGLGNYNIFGDAKAGRACYLSRAAQHGSYLMSAPWFHSTLLALALTVGVASAANAYSGEQLAKDAKFTLEEARRIALEARPGKITDQELEREHGGSGLRYSFDVLAGGQTFEVGVDAQTGRILENTAEGPNPD